MSLCPDLTALEVQGKKFSYKELVTLSMQTASMLVNLGASCEAIGVVGQKSPSSYLGVLGTIFAGCHYVPINLKYDAQKQIKILKDSKIRILIGDSDDLECFYEKLDSEVSDSIEFWLDPCRNTVNPIKNWLSQCDFEKIEIHDKPITDKVSELAYVMYTSGSTGFPKGVMVTNENLLSWLKSMNSLYNFEKGFRSSQTYDLSFDLSVADIFFTFDNLGTLCVPSKDDELLPTDYIIRENIEYWSSVPTLVSFMNSMGVLEPNVFPNIKYSSFCGEALPEKLAKAWSIAAPNSSIENFYGPTEATIWITRYNYQATRDNSEFCNGNVPIGLPFPDHEVKLTNKDGSLVEKNEMGEIVYCGPQITNGYLNDTLKTESAFVNFRWDIEGRTWYRSGDIGFYNINGNIECVGRIDNQIKLGGRRIELGEIEVALMKSNQINDIIVVPVRNIDKSAKHLVAFTTNSVSKESWSDITKSSNIESIFIPKKLFKIDSFPINTSGKLNRKELEELADTLS